MNLTSSTCTSMSTYVKLKCKLQVIMPIYYACSTDSKIKCKLILAIRKMKQELLLKEDGRRNFRYKEEMVKYSLH